MRPMLRQFVSLWLMLLVAHNSASAELATYWVLGSFSNIANAEAEQKRLNHLLDGHVQLRHDPALAVFRVIAPADRIDRLALADIPAWRINLPVSTQTSQKQALTPTAPTDTPRPLQTPLVEQPMAAIEDNAPNPLIESVSEQPSGDPVPLFPALHSGESISEYCLRVPGEALCQHPDIEKALATDRKLLNHRQEMQSICKKITNLARRETCEQLHLGE